MQPLTLCIKFAIWNWSVPRAIPTQSVGTIKKPYLHGKHGFLC
jgi:hypothetical protein